MKKTEWPKNVMLNSQSWVGKDINCSMNPNSALAGITNSELHKPGITNLELCYVEFQAWMTCFQPYYPAFFGRRKPTDQKNVMQNASDLVWQQEHGSTVRYLGGRQED